MYVHENGGQWGEWEKKESIEEFLASWVKQGKQEVPYFNRDYCTMRFPDFLIESLMDDSCNRDLGIGFSVKAFSHDGEYYVASVANGDQPLADVDTREEWNRKVSALLMP